MTTTSRHPLIEDYLRQLERASARLPKDTRLELMAEIRAHVDAGAAEATSEADIRNVLDALGAPADIVDAADLGGEAASSVPTGRLALALGIVALCLMLPIPFVAVPVGLVGVTLGLQVRRRRQSLGLNPSTATAGAICGGVALVVSVFVMVVLMAGSTSVEDEPVTVVDSPMVTAVPG